MRMRYRVPRGVAAQGRRPRSVYRALGSGPLAALDASVETHDVPEFARFPLWIRNDDACGVDGPGPVDGEPCLGMGCIITVTYILVR